MLSLRKKLTLYYLGILAVVLLIFGSAIYTFLARSLLTTIDEALDHEAQQIEAKMSAGAGDDPTAETSAPAHGGHEQLQLSPQVLQFIDAQGNVTDEVLAYPADQLPIDDAALNRLAAGITHFDTGKTAAGETMRVAVRRLKDQEGDTYFIRLGQSLEPLERARRRLLLVLALAIPPVLLLFSYGGLLLANQALRPVDRITNTAEQIGAGDLSGRVPLPAKMDEVGRLAATFNKMIARLEAAFERQRQFTSDASHELRTPLAVMRGETEITLRRERPSEEYRRVLTSNLEEIVRLQRLVEDLLTLARADVGHVELQREPVALDELCQQMVEYISPLAETREQTLNYEPAGEVTINADAQRLKQLLLNLLDNAIKYTDPGGRITLGLKTASEEVVLSVADTGRGIPPEDLPHVFERFFRRSQTTADRSAAGFGLGLSIVKWIVDSHDWRIEAASEPGKGTIFTVRIPAAAK